MTIAIVTEKDWRDGRLRTYSAPATQVEGFAGSLVLWPKSERPIRVPWAACYWLRFKELP